MNYKLDSLSSIMSLGGLAIGAMAGMAAYSLAAQKQAFVVNFVASVVITALVEILLHASSVYRELPELGRLTLGLRNIALGFAILDAYLRMMGFLATNVIAIQNNFAFLAASLSGTMVVELSSHLYCYIDDFTRHRVQK